MIAIDCNFFYLLIFEEKGPNYASWPKSAPNNDSFSLLIFEENYLIIPLDENQQQTVTRFGCVGFSMYASEFAVPQMQQFCLFTYPPRSKWASSEKMIFFAKIGIFCKSIAGPLPSVIRAYTQPYSFGWISYQIRHELVEKKTLDGGLFIWSSTAFASQKRELSKTISFDDRLLLTT